VFNDNVKPIALPEQGYDPAGQFFIGEKWISLSTKFIPCQE
jgi:hypothetical protein